MVFYQPPKRQPRKADDGKIIELADEILLKIHKYLSPLDTLNFRITCKACIPAGNTAVSLRMKKLYISPARSSLLAAVQICAHKEFASRIEEVVVLGSVPQREEVVDRASRTQGLRRGFGNWLLTWPTEFPTASKTVGHRRLYTSASDGFSNIYKPLLDALVTLPRLTKLSFASKVSRSRPGFNQIKQSSLDSFPKRHLNKPSVDHERWSDGYVMFAILAALDHKIRDFGFCDRLADSYRDLLQAEDEFAFRLVEDNMDDDDGEMTDDGARIWGNFFGGQGTFFMPKTTFAVSEGSAIAGIRRHRLKDSPLPITFMQQNGEEGLVNLWMGPINAG